MSESGISCRISSASSHPAGCCTAFSLMLSAMMWEPQTGEGPPESQNILFSQVSQVIMLQIILDKIINKIFHSCFIDQTLPLKSTLELFSFLFFFTSELLCTWQIFFEVTSQRQSLIYLHQQTKITFLWVIIGGFFTHGGRFSQEDYLCLVRNQKGQVFLTEITACTFQESMATSYGFAIYIKPGQRLHMEHILMLSAPQVIEQVIFFQS